MKTKRLLAMLLCICMVTAILPMASAAEAIEKNFAEGDYYGAYNVQKRNPGDRDFSDTQIFLARASSMTNKWIAFNVGELSGDYDITFNYVKKAYGAKSDIYLVKANSRLTPNVTSGTEAWVNSEEVMPAAEKIELGSVDYYAATEQAATANFSVEGLEAGEYLIVTEFTAHAEEIESTGCSYVSPKSVKFTPATEEDPTPEPDEPQETVSTNFGENYAYLTKDETGSYKLTFIGGIKEIEGYSEVGFEINGEKIGNKSVYEKFSYDGNEVSFGTYFGEGVNYVFKAAESFAPGTEITFRAYSVKGEGESAVYEYGNSYTVTVPALAQ